MHPNPYFSSLFSFIETLDLVSIFSLLLGIAGVAYGVHAKRQSDKASRGSMLGADEAPALMPVLSANGFNFHLMNQAKFPQFDVWVRVFDFARDTIIDPSEMVPGVVNHPIFRLPELYPNNMHSKPFFEIELRQRTRSRVNFFIHTRNAQSSVEVVAIRDDSGSKIAFKQRFSESKEVVEIPANFPVMNRGNPKSLFAEDKPTGAVYIKTPEGLKPAIPT
jgi:hypothetical protein